MTQYNVFIRIFGDKAVIMTVVDWEDFKELEHSQHESPDFLVGAVTNRSIYSNLLRSILVNTSAAKDITDKTRDMGLEAILTRRYS